ncbi:MAG: 4Fe-4S dicluster domain-containing protein [Planctomycetes bacterium]|nr:4Fe-4S dicluster domain-containing protein [Planctomycetota bacterium]
MLKKARLLLAGIFLIGMLLLFIDAGGIIPPRFAFLAKIQLVPAILAGSAVTVALWLLLTCIFGRIYCSIICPLGVFQDVAAYFGKKNRFHFTAGKIRLRIVFLAIFIAAFLTGLPVVFGILEPYSAFGRLAAGILAPFWSLGHNALAYLSEKSGYLAIASSPIWIKGTSALAFAILTFGLVGYLAFRGGRTWCNTLCPAGTALGFLARFSFLRPRISADACNRCGLCEMSCKASCLDGKNRRIDASRCVVCFNCLGACKYGAIKYSLPAAASKETRRNDEPPDRVRRNLLTAVFGALILPISSKALEASEPKEETIPALTRKTRQPKRIPVIPPGAWGLREYSARCTGCQLCVSSCPNRVLAASDSGLGMLQPSLSFERGYCRVNCVTCSTVCPTGAIRPITAEEKTAIQIGRAVVDRSRCIRRTRDVACTACIRNCPAGVINPIEKEDHTKDIAVDLERCLGCGACEYFCPVRPTGAITVIGNVRHHRL